MVRYKTVRFPAPRVLWIFILALTAWGRAGSSTDPLPPRYRNWLDQEVVYIVSPVERQVFLQLQTDRERDVFIEAFWRQRDPTPGTPANEFKTEHYVRLTYVNRYFSRSAPKPGWKTDRGRIYIILGKPMNVLNLENKQGLNPAEIWYYEDLAKFGLPDGLNLIFYQEHGLGDYKLYSPTLDGPQALLQAYSGRANDFEAAYNAILDLEPSLANPSLSLISGEAAGAQLRSALSSDIVLDKIQTVPWAKIEDLYARKFLEFKDRIEVEYSTNYLTCSPLVRIQLDPSGIALVHYAVEIGKLSLAEYDHKFATALKISGSVNTPEGKPVYQFDKTASLNVSEAQLPEILRQPFNYHDVFPLIAGRYQLSVLIKNEVSKEFTSFEQTLVVPESVPAPRIAPLLLGYRVSPAAIGAMLKPFQFGPFQLYVQPGQMFARKETLTFLAQALGLNDSLKAGASLRWAIVRDGRPVLEKERPLREYAEFPICLESIPLADLAPAYYKLTVSLAAGGRELAAAAEDFIVSPADALPRPWVYSRLMPASGDPQFLHVIGGQYFNTGQWDKAKARLEQAWAMKPEAVDIAQNLAQTYMVLGETAKVPPLLSRFLADEKSPVYEVYLLGGRAWQRENEPAKALDVFTKAVSHFGVNTVLLNAIADCCLKLNRPQDALTSWENSLRLDPRQTDVQKRIAALRNKK